MYTGQNGASVSFTVTVSAGDRLQSSAHRRTRSRADAGVHRRRNARPTATTGCQLPISRQINILMPNAGTFPITLTNLRPSGQYHGLRRGEPAQRRRRALDEGTTYQETSSSLIYSGQWIASNDASYSGGHVYYTSQPDSPVTFMVNGTAGHYLVLYRTKGPDKGSMEVCFSQIYNCQTISNSHGSTSSTSSRSAFALPWTATYPVTVRFTGTLGQYMDIDKVALSSVQVLALSSRRKPTDTPTPETTEAMTEPPNPRHRNRRRH